MKAYWQKTTAETRLWMCVVGSGLIYLAFTAPFQLSRYYAVSPPVDYAKLTRYSAIGFTAYLCGVTALFGFYLIGMRTLAQNQGKIAEGSNPGFVLLSGASFALVLLLSYPQTAIDLLVYAIRTRGWALYGLSPFTFSPDTFPATDPWLSLAGEWADEASPYGPVWEWLSLGAYHLSGGNYLSHLFALKIISGIAYLVSAWLVYRIMLRIRPQWALVGTAFFAWNPLVLFECVQNAHNDIIMVVFLLIAVWAYVQWLEQPKIWTGLVFAVTFIISILVKFVTLLVLPFFLLGMALRQPNWARRISVMVLFGLAIMLSTIAVLGPNWPGWESSTQLLAGKGDLDFVGALLGFLPNSAGRSVVALLVLAQLPQTGSTSLAFDNTNVVIYLIFGGIYLWGIWRVACQGRKCNQGASSTLESTRELPLRVSFYILFWYTLFVASVFHAWYLLWFMPLAAMVIPNKQVTSGAFVFSVMALLIIPYYETIRVWIPYLNQNHLLGHIIGVPLLLVPVLLALWKPLQVLPEETHA